MTTRPRRTSGTRADGVPTEQAPAPAPEPAETMTAPSPVLPGPIPVVDRLVILDAYAGPDGLLPVVVIVSHDAVFAGQHIRVPITDRVAGLIEKGFLEVDLHDMDPQ